MKTWSLADVFDVFKKVEQLTRPPRRDDEPVAVLSEECRAPDPSDCLSCGKRCTWPDEAIVERPACSCGLGDGVKLREHWSSCAVWDDDQAGPIADVPPLIIGRDVTVGPRYCGSCDETHDDPCTAMYEPSWLGRLTEDDDQVAKLADMEAEMDRQVGEAIEFDEVAARKAHAAALGFGDLGYFAKDGTYKVIPKGEWYFAQPDVQTGNFPGPTEPALTDDELVAVRGLIQERYEGPRPKWLHELLVATGDWASEILSGATPSSCGHRYCERQGYGLCFGVLGAQVDFIEDTSPASASVIPTGADAEPDSPAASAAGASGEAVSPIPPEPASPRSGPRDLSQYNTTHCCRYCGCSGVVAHFDNCTRPTK